MKKFWRGVSLLCICGAALSLWRQDYDAAFVIGTIGVLAWFLNYRARMKETIDSANDDESEQED
jgi:hypothetical protein